MNREIQRHAARMRLQNAERLRNSRWRWIAVQSNAGNLTPKEAAQLKREFWEERLRDKELAK